MISFTRILAAIAILGVSIAWHADAGAGKIPKSDSKVKATATATKADANGNQTVTITLNIDKGWHLYANPVNANNDFLADSQTVVKVAAKEKVQYKVKYPAGKTHIEKKDQYDIYEGTVKIQANVTRAKGDTSPLEISVIVNACDDKNCLMTGTVKLMVP